MDFIVVIIIVIIVVAVFFGFKQNNDNKLDAHLENLNQQKGNNYENWIALHEKELKVEEEKIDNGYYDQYRYIDFDVAGIRFRPRSAQETIDELDLISFIQFVKEPHNSYDSNAVKVLYCETMIGYVPRCYSGFVTKLINQNLIQKIFVMDSGDDILSEKDEKYVNLRVYYIPTKEELEYEQEKMRIAQEKKERIAKRMQEEVELPTWVDSLLLNMKNARAINEQQKLGLKRLKDNIRNSVKSYEKAIRTEKESIAENALNRLEKYNKDLEILMKESMS